VGSRLAEAELARGLRGVASATEGDEVALVEGCAAVAEGELVVDLG
jgi:hypothetical protein